MKNEKQINIKFTDEEFKIVQTLKRKYAINITQFFKNCMEEKLSQLDTGKNKKI